MLFHLHVVRFPCCSVSMLFGFHVVQFQCCSVSMLFGLHVFRFPCQHDVIIAIRPSIFNALPWPDLKEIVMSARNGNIKTHNNRRTKIPKWLGQENEEIKTRTRNCCGWPSFPPLYKRNSISLLTRKYNISGRSCCIFPSFFFHFFSYSIFFMISCLG